MTTTTVSAQQAAPVAALDRRFYAFALDRLVAWSAVAVVGAAAWWWLFREDRVLAGVLVAAAGFLLVGLVLAVLLGTRGTSPGKAAYGLRVVDPTSGRPIGVGRAVLRTVILGVATLPTFGLGTATLAWTAVEDPSRERRGWHDRKARSIVVDVRPVEVVAAVEDERPRHVVNLTAMRLNPVRQTATPALPAPAVTPTVSLTAGLQQPSQHSPQQSWQPAARQQPSVQQGPDQQPPGPSAYVPPSVPQADRPTTAPRDRGRHAADSGPATGRPDGPGAPATRTRWRVTFDSGETFLVEGLGLVGRRPEGRAGEPVRHVVPLVSENMSISKTHAQFHLAGDGALVVMDRGSTNGSILVRRGVSRELSAGRPATLLDGDRVLFGDREMRVVREQG
ncbi:FHA domain-containing protein [Nocardioides guangzhouensis]|uniref:FHA domain-containing protein n=1 Tax=Nocardioides guangzhouensis TaxID=2497878 RepID=A0A4V1XYX8_9ACTN|nr:RDD family protein [Nocardioides guangzhouensis]RYP84799.1 FHA domain-containing protein [Nocardioides guangzhouensis]